MVGKKFDESSQIGDHGIALIHKRVAEMGHVWHERQRDVGIDGQIEIRDPSTGEVANRFLLVQSKAREREFAGENDDRFHYICDERDLDYWMSADSPVILVCSHPSAETAWWAHVQAWFADPARRASRRIDFDKATQGFDARTSDRLLALADPTGLAHAPVMLNRREVLISTLLPVDVPETMFSASVKVSGTAEIVELVRNRQSGPKAWLYRNGTVYTFPHPEELGIGSVLAGPIQAEHPTAYALEDTPCRNIVVQLLSRALREDTAADLWFDPDTRSLSFKAASPLRTLQRQGPHGKLREVVHVNRNKQKGHVNWVRHMAFRWRFVLDGDEWLMDATPDYRFTVDGYRPSSRSADLTSGIKRLERHAAVRGQLEFWAHYLRPAEANLLDAVPQRWLTFHPPLRFEVDYGINDEAWDDARALFKSGGAPGEDTLWEVQV